MMNLPARTGWEWIKQGFGLFGKQPGALFSLFAIYAFFMLLIGIVPVLGQILPILLVPVGAVAFMQACALIEQGKRVRPSVLLSGLRKPFVLPLLKLGTLYFVMAAIAVGSTFLVDGGVLWQILTGQLDPRSAAAQAAPIGPAMLLAIAVYIPAAMAFCFAAPLIYWQGMGVAKASFFSFFAVWRARKAFLVFCMSWFALIMFVSNLFVLIFGTAQQAILLMLPVSILLTIVMHCSFYASYRQLFGTPVVDVIEASV